MRTIIFCILALFISIVSKAQSNTASLGITLTDIQSVKFSNVPLNEIAPVTKKASQNGTLQLLSHSTSQIKKISSNASEYARLYKEFYSDAGDNVSSSNNQNVYSAVVNRANPKITGQANNFNLVIYQIDPR